MSDWTASDEDMDQHWKELALDLNMESQWAHACSWILAARLAKSVDECRFSLDMYPTGVGSVPRVELTKDFRRAS